MNALIGNQAQEWGLFKLYRQTLAKRLVKDGVACRVREIGEDNGVLVRESWCAVKIEVPCAEECQPSYRTLPALRRSVPRMR